jgi:hypothetical protein
MFWLASSSFRRTSFETGRLNQLVLALRLYLFIGDSDKKSATDEIVKALSYLLPIT